MTQDLLKIFPKRKSISHILVTAVRSFPLPHFYYSQPAAKENRVIYTVPSVELGFWPAKCAKIPQTHANLIYMYMCIQTLRSICSASFDFLLCWWSSLRIE